MFWEMYVDAGKYPILQWLKKKKKKEKKEETFQWFSTSAHRVYNDLFETKVAKAW